MSTRMSRCLPAPTATGMCTNPGAMCILTCPMRTIGTDIDGWLGSIGRHAVT